MSRVQDVQERPHQIPPILGHMAIGFLPYVQDERYVTGAGMRRSDPAKYRPSLGINPFLAILAAWRDQGFAVAVFS